MFSLSSFQANLHEIYVALCEVKGQCTDISNLPLYVRPSRVYFTGNLCGKVIQFWDYLWEKIVKIWDRTWHPPLQPSVEVTLQSILNKDFNFAVHQAYEARQKRILDNVSQINENSKNSSQACGFSEQFKRCMHYFSEETKGYHFPNQPLHLENFESPRSLILSVKSRKNQRHEIITFHRATHFFWSLFAKENKEDSVKIGHP